MSLRDLIKRRYTVVLSSDDIRSEVDMELTTEGLAILVGLAAALNRQATWSADIRMQVESSAAQQGDAA